MVVAERRSKLGGKFVDDLGWYDPHSKNFEIKKEKVEHWIKVGAKPTNSAHNLLVRAGVIDEPKIAVHSTKKKKKGEEETVAAPAEVKAEVKAEVEAPAAEEKTKEVPKKEEKTKPKPEESKPEETPKEEAKPKKEKPTSSADKKIDAE